MSEVNRPLPSDSLIERFVDLPELLDRVENDRELLTELFVMFQQELPGLQDALRDAASVADLPQAAKAAHTLKGMLANMSMKSAVTMATGIEAAARAGNMLGVKKELVSFDAELEKLSVAVDAFIAGK